ncbi:MAG: tetratricopeptide repeat protein [Hyphomicrobiales bacterium]|nr:tetratricopeptide repeat protein [Hyphomicrobiales bacterium]
MTLSKLLTSSCALLIGGALSVSVINASEAIEDGHEALDAYAIVDSDSLLGSYLAGRLARSLRDNEAAADYYHEALEKDPASTQILEEAFQLKVVTGDFPEALRLAKELAGDSSDYKIASLFLGIDAFRNGRYDESESYFISAGNGPIIELTARLARAWMALDQGLAEHALKIVDDVKSPQTPGAEQIEQINRALIADIGGLPKTAASIFAKLYESNPGNIRLAASYARHAAHNGDFKLAREILKPHLSDQVPSPLADEIIGQLDAGQTPALAIDNARDGMAEVFQSVGEALGGDRVIDAGQIYLQLALFTKPELPLAHYALGELYDQAGNVRLAAETFAKLPESSPFWLNAQLRRAYALSALERGNEAKDVLQALIKAYPKDMRPYYTMGNILRSNKEFAEGVDYYNKAIELLGPEDRSHWSIYYARGVCYERIQKWDLAEKDLSKALELDPDQELVMNYLGYSWVDQNLNLKEAMRLIERAVEKKPRDGYFVDSLGWAYYRLNDFETAVNHLERAVELKPGDSVINDHLGDAYWKVGRRLEANYQWSLALGLDPEPEDEAKIREKLEKGLVEDTTTRAALEDGAELPQSKTQQ